VRRVNTVFHKPLRGISPNLPFWSSDELIWFWGQEVKGQDHDQTKSMIKNGWDIHINSCQPSSVQLNFVLSEISRIRTEYSYSTVRVVCSLNARVTPIVLVLCLQCAQVNYLRGFVLLETDWSTLDDVRSTVIRRQAERNWARVEWSCQLDERGGTEWRRNVQLVVLATCCGRTTSGRGSALSSQLVDAGRPPARL